MLQRLYILSLILLLCAACAPQPLTSSGAPTVLPFPTMTPGRLMRGFLPTVLPQNSNLANPATAVALASRPTATPDYGDCPSLASPPVPTYPINTRSLPDEIANFLSAGASPAALENLLRVEWGILGEDGVVRGDFDLTGEGQAEVLVTYTSPGEGGEILVLGCADGRYIRRYEATPGGAVPRLIQVGDMNYDNRPDIMFTAYVCESEDVCTYNTQIITWRSQLGRFVSLVDRPLTTAEVPSVQDMDDDQVSEIIVRMENPGNASTGPLRTGVIIYDWNGAAYVQSITQLNPPRFRIQAVQIGDDFAARRDMANAISMYEFALDVPTLETWRNGEESTLKSYLLYRLLLAHAYLEDDLLLPTYQRILTDFPDAASAPVYVEMSTAFWNTLQVTNNLRSACVEARAVVQRRPEALDLLNRYGSSSPVYTLEMLCPY